MRLTAAILLAIGLFAPDTALSVNFERPKDEACTNIDNCDAVAKALVNIVQANGNRCDSVSSVQKWALSRGFSIYCNNFSYEYEVEDKGGNWILKVID